MAQPEFSAPLQNLNSQSKHFFFLAKTHLYCSSPRQNYTNNLRKTLKNIIITMSFSFGFGGDDIDTSNDAQMQPAEPPQPTIPPAQAGAFPVAGKPQLPAVRHDLSQMLAAMPSKIAYSLLEVTLEDGSIVQLPRRELWDVRVQLMAEEEENPEHGVNADGSGLGTHDVKTGVYEGGFKSWESSVDLVKVLASQGKASAAQQLPMRIIEV